MDINSYLDKINQHYKSGLATEHTFRGDLARLIESLAPGVAATNEPKRIACGAPDYVISRKGTACVSGRQGVRHRDHTTRLRGRFCLRRLNVADPWKRRENSAAAGPGSDNRQADEGP